jgi:hypothetical protein
MSEAEKLMRDLEANYKSSLKMLLESLEKCSIGTNSYLGARRSVLKVR